MSRNALDPVTFVVVGASGDLARKKLLPALFALYSQGFLPRDFRVFGFARTPFGDAEFRARVAENLTCRYVPGEACADRIREFLERCHYTAGQYDSADAFLNLYQAMREKEGRQERNRVFYLSIPPQVFLGVAHAIGGAGLVQCGNRRVWSRAVLEKPFGRDRASSDRLTAEMARVFEERETYRIDHYLGKEVIQNLMVLRFANLVFEPIWNRAHVRRVTIEWKEDIGVEGRGGYFDAYGIIRDVIQNHLLQILALTAMERPASVTAGHVGDEKVKVLRAVPPLTPDDVALGQYTAGTRRGLPHPGYTDDPTVPRDSRTPTFAAAALRVDNERWRGVPFVIMAGKGLDGGGTTVTIHFRDVAGNVFCDRPLCLPANRLSIRIQPDEAIMLHVVNKQPGLQVALVESDLNLRYRAAFDALIPDAYECLLLDVLEGDKSLFIRCDELEAAWDIFTPLLHAIEARGIAPEPYAFGSAGPAGMRRVLSRA
ncbi:MAG: glucose-6-phosphate dehydrogenase [Lentisphaerae bacterium]|nr:glucose-6-phosphate dehydrogenase [Lentisphaerota bacterium]